MDGVASLGQNDALPQKFRQAFARSATAVDVLQDMGPELLASLKGNVYLQRRPKPGQGCVDEPVGRSKSSATLSGSDAVYDRCANSRWYPAVMPHPVMK